MKTIEQISQEIEDTVNQMMNERAMKEIAEREFNNMLFEQQTKQYESNNHHKAEQQDSRLHF